MEVMSSWVMGAGRSPVGLRLQRFGTISKEERASLVAQLVTNPPAMQETWVQSLVWQDSLEKEMASHFSIFAWRIPWTEEPGRVQSMGLQRVRHE